MSVTTEHGDEIIEKYLSGIGCETIAKEYGCYRSTIHRFLKRNNVPIRKLNEYRKYSLNEHVFDVLDTEEKNYFLGLMYADGFNVAGKNEFGLALSGEDGYMVEKFQQFFETDRPVMHHAPSLGRGQEVHELRLNSEHVSNRLTELGCPPQKSFKIEFPTFLEDKYVRDFIRGYLDGDGSIYNNGSIMQIQMLGNLKFCQQLQQVLFDKKIYSNYYKDRNIWSLRICSRDMYKFGFWIYDDATIFLSRKYKKFCQE